tara:strand:- start:262 stop:525 length:264 start_codon:yes stop_codon:yes gene_type:complete
MSTREVQELQAGLTAGQIDDIIHQTKRGGRGQGNAMAEEKKRKHQEDGQLVDSRKQKKKAKKEKKKKSKHDSSQGKKNLYKFVSLKK